MRNRKPSLVGVFVTGLLFLGAVRGEAALIDRGGGLIYDDVLNVTWLQDAQFAQTSGYAQFGRLNWADANAWAAGLEYYDSVRGITWNDWRLPTTVNDPSSLGYDTNGLNSELAYMYYVNLGYAPNLEHDRFAPAPTSSNYNPFVNLAYRGYWSETMGPQGQAWMFHFHFGSTELDGPNDEQRIWAVRDGDVAAIASQSVPEPTTLAFLGVGLAGFLSRKRRI
ncbi:MAG TPA: DUF1566 domain-containing protein [Vicinamibacterales bacterium]|jgi:hypothetical protein